VPDDAARIETEARRLFDARKAGVSTDLVTDSWPDISPKQAQRIAVRTLAMVGQPRCGIKLGYTSAAMRQQMNIDRPNFGHLTKDMDFGGGVITPLIHPRAEPEIALRTARDMVVAPTTRENLSSLVDAVFPALEIVDTRYHDYVFRYEDNVADNSSAAGFVLGKPHGPEVLQNDGLAVSLTPEGQDPLTGHSSAAMGGPLEALAWLCHELEASGEMLPAGFMILTGGLTSAPYLELGVPIRIDFQRLGHLTFTW
jgi:2-keto-4-pentenoate hydratase